ncbi:MAG: hypothetical protein RIT43_6 [Bacteroidota bacterium]|jgi:hypothetical protein
MSFKSLFLWFSCLGLFVSCSYNPFEVDITNVKTGIGYLNLDSMLVKTSPNDIPLMNERCKFELGELYAYQLGYCFRFANDADTTVQKGLSLYFSDPGIQIIERELGSQFSSVAEYNKAIDDGFRRLKVHFPKMKVPKKVVYLNSLLNFSVFSTGEQIGVGLEWHLGPDSKWLKKLPEQLTPQWKKEAMLKEYIARDAIVSWLETHIVPKTDGDLASEMVRWGKIIYFLQAAFPGSEPHSLLRYTPKEYEWAIENEQNIWDYLIKQNMLFKINDLNERNLLSEGPFTPGIQEKSPDRLGQFVGYKMVKKYMDIRRISLEELRTASYSDVLSEYEID